MSQLYVQDCRLNSIQPRVCTFLNVYILLFLSVVSKTVQLLRKVIVVSDYCASVTVSAEVLTRIKTETASQAKRAAALAQEARAMRLRCVFDNF